MKKKGRSRRTVQRLSQQERKRLAFNVAALHYGTERMTQAEIADRLNLARMQVSRLLEHAHQLHLVEMPRLRPPRSNRLEPELYKRLPRLTRVAVSLTAQWFKGDEEDQKTEIQIQPVSQLAADFWQDYVHPTNTGKLRIALGGGRAIAKLVDLVVLDNVGADIEVLAISNIPYGDWETSANTNLAVLKRRFKEITIRPLLAMQLSSEMTPKQIAEQRKQILKLGIISEHFHDASQCSLVFTGIGSVEDSHLSGRLRQLGLAKSDYSGAVGDLSYNLIYHDTHVFHDDCPLNSRLITVPIDTLLKISTDPGRFVVVVAWGKRKAPPALDAYRAGVYNALIIDEEMAEEMISLIDNGYLEELTTSR